MFERGALFHLIAYLFLYDYSVEEDGDIERNTKSHKQVSWLIGLFVCLCFVWRMEKERETDSDSHTDI